MTIKKKQNTTSTTAGFDYQKHEVFDALFSLVNDGVALFKAVDNGNDFTLLAINSAGLRIAGLPAEEIYKIPLSEGYARLQKMALFEAVKRVYTTGESECVQFHTVNEDGEKIWLDYCYSRLPDGLVVSICHDVSEKRRAEEEAKSGEQRFYALFNDISDAVFIHLLNADGSIGSFVDVNDAACMRLEYTREELMRLSPQDIDAGELTEARKNAVKNVVDKGHAVFTMVHISKLGRRIPVEINSHKVRFHEKDFIVSVARDITERIEADQKIRISEEKYRESFDNSPVSLWEEDLSRVFEFLESLREKGITDIRDYFAKKSQAINRIIESVKIIDINRAAVELHKATSKDELIHNLSGTLTDDSREMFKSEVAAIWDKQTEFSREGVLQTIDGDLINVIVRWKVVPGYEHNYGRILVSIVDITERKKTELQLEESERKFRELIDLAPDAFLLGNFDGTIITANQKSLALSGYSLHEFSEMHIYDLFSENERQRVPLRFDLLKSGQTVVSERKLLRKDGSEIWIEMNTKQMPNGMYQSFIRDISGRKKTEYEMSLFYEVAKRMKNGMYVYQLENENDDHTLKMISTNAAGSERMGLLREAIIGKYIDEIFPRLRDNDIPKKFADVVRTGVPFRSEEYFYGDDRIRPSIFTFEAIALPDNSVCVLFEDVTMQKQQEAEIHRNHERLQSLVKILEQDTTSIQSFLDNALNEVIAITGSMFGYIYFYDEATETFELNTWSKEVMHECTVMNPQTKYMLDKTGVWGDAVRNRAPVIINKFDAPNPHKKGYPEGHVQLHNFLTVPVMSVGKIVAVVGVANKSSDYTETDVLQLTLLMDSVWKSVEQVRAEQALRHSEARYRAITKLSTDFAYSCVRNDEGIYNVDWISDGFYKLSRYSEQDLSDHGCWLFTLDENDFEEVFEVLHSLKIGESDTREFRMYTKNGRALEITNYAECVADFAAPEGKRLYGAVRDLTEHKKIELELAETVERFKALHNASFGGIAIHEKGIILECNQGLSDMMGYSVDELIGMNGLLLIAPEHRDMVMGNIVAGYEKPYEADGLRKNGEHFPMRLEARNIPYKGRNVRTVEFRDLTESKQAEKALRESEQKFRQTFDFSPVGSVIVGLDKKFIKSNKSFANFLHYTQEELVGKTIDEVTYQEDRDIGMNEMKLVMTGDIEKAIVRKRYITKNGTIVWGETSISLVRDGNGAPLFFLPTIVDITEKKTADDELNKKAEELEHFNKLMLGREYKMVELKREINEMCEKAGLPPRYNLSFAPQDDLLKGEGSEHNESN